MSATYETFAARLGGRIWRPTDPDVAEAFLGPFDNAFQGLSEGRVLQRNRMGDIWAVQAELLDLKEPPNAFVGKEEALYCIAMPYTTPVHFWTWANRIFAETAIFPFVGEPAPIPLGPGGKHWLVEGRMPAVDEIDAAFLARQAPVDRNRQAIAGWLSSLCLELIWQHELGHVINGHIDFDIAQSGRRWRPEALTEIGIGLTLPDDQMMEIYADQFSLQPLVRRMRDLHAGGRRQYLTLAQHAAVLRFALFLVTATWCLADLVRGGRFAAARAGSHPPSVYRLFFGNEALDQIMAAFGIEQEVIVQSQALYTQAVQLVIGRYEEFELVAAELQATIDDNMAYAYEMRQPQAYFARWAPYSFFPILTPEV